MNRFDIEYVEPQDFLANTYDYPVYTHLKGDSLYVRKDDGTYHRDDFHQNPEAYRCLFPQYLACTDILMNGIYWDKNIPRLFEKEDITRDDFKIRVIADITCDQDGSVPINYGASTIADPVYGIHRTTGEKTAPFLPGDETIDVMAVDNLPNELPRDASIHFGSHLKKFILPELLSSERSEMIERATICEQGKLTPYYEYLSDYAYE
jgi:saccharopine dehydrogenase (NAD+, L-lysine-forming)